MNVVVNKSINSLAITFGSIFLLNEFKTPPEVAYAPLLFCSREGTSIRNARQQTNDFLLLETVSNVPLSVIRYKKSNVSTTCCTRCTDVCPDVIEEVDRLCRGPARNCKSNGYIRNFT